MYTAIFGGTFNPIHNGHYQMLNSLQNDPIIDEILITPDKIPPHKICDFIADDNIRIAMCNIAAGEFNKAKLCLVEFERDGKSYSFDTVIKLQKDHPNKNFAFVCGGDMLVSLDKWYKFDELIKLLPFVVFKRKGTDLKLFNLKKRELEALGGKFIIKEDEIDCISSTQIRSDFKNGFNLIPKSIYEFLNERGVYSD